MHTKVGELLGAYIKLGFFYVYSVDFIKKKDVIVLEQAENFRKYSE